MKHPVDAAQRASDRLPVENVAPGGGDVQAAKRRQIRRRADQRADLVAAANQQPRQVRPEKPVAPVTSVQASSFAVVERRDRAGAQRGAPPAPAPAEGKRPEGGDPAAEHEPGDSGADQHLALMGAHLGAPVGELGHLDAQLLQRGAELLAVLLDRGADLRSGLRVAIREARRFW